MTPTDQPQSTRPPHALALMASIRAIDEDLRSLETERQDLEAERTSHQQPAPLDVVELHRSLGRAEVSKMTGGDGDPEAIRAQIEEAQGTHRKASQAAESRRAEVQAKLKELPSAVAALMARRAEVQRGFQDICVQHLMAERDAAIKTYELQRGAVATAYTEILAITDLLNEHGQSTANNGRPLALPGIPGFDNIPSLIVDATCQEVAGMKTSIKSNLYA